MLTIALALAVTPAAPPPPTDAERWLREADARLVAAKTLRIEFEIRRTEKPDEPALKGSLALGTDNRLRYEMSGWMTASVVSDGKQMAMVVVSPAERKIQPMPEWAGETLRAWLGRGGTYVAATRLVEFIDAGASRPGPEDGPRVSNAKLAADEKVGKITAKVIEYDLAWDRLPPDTPMAKVRVWIDPETRLPIQRTMTFQPGAKPESFTAVHTKLEIDPKLDDTLFRLPK